MACYCGVCARPLGDAMENYGGFSVSPGFKGWDQKNGQSVIQDTCISCWRILGEAVAVAATKIASENSNRVSDLSDKIIKWGKEEELMKRKRREFESAWWAEQEKHGK